MPERRRVIVESPYAGDVEANVDFARACVRDSLQRGEAPIASHLLYTQPGILDDDVPAERQMGIAAGLAWLAVADASVVYVDRGVTQGMRYGIKAARVAGNQVEFRMLHLQEARCPDCGKWSAVAWNESFPPGGIWWDHVDARRDGGCPKCGAVVCVETECDFRKAGEDRADG